MLLIECLRILRWIFYVLGDPNKIYSYFFLSEDRAFRISFHKGLRISCIYFKAILNMSCVMFQQ